jgi:hypothetical protein
MAKQLLAHITLHIKTFTWSLNNQTREDDRQEGREESGEKEFCIVEEEEEEITAEYCVSLGILCYRRTERCADCYASLGKCKEKVYHR